MEFRILGPFEAVHDGRPVALGHRERTLLALLLLSANRVVSNDRLVDELWVGSPPVGATKALQVSMSRLRTALRAVDADRALVTRPPGYILRVEPEAIDAACFATLVATGRERLSGGAAHAEEAAELFRQGLALWRGPALADLVDQPFARAEADRLEEARLGALEDRLQAEVAGGHHAEVLPELEALTREHPLRERLWGQRMLALYRAGRQAEALRAYQSLRHHLREELGLEPGPELAQLEAAILRHDPALQRPGPIIASRVAAEQPPRLLVLPLPPEMAAEPTPFMVGRDADLERATGFLADAARPRLGVIWLLGEPGIGKSRLAREVARQAHEAGAVVVSGSCSEDLAVPYQPFVEALRWFVSHLDDGDLTARLGRHPGELTRLSPDLTARRPGLEPTRSPTAETEQYQLYEGVRSWLATGGGVQPLVAVFDDVHWAAQPTLALLGHVARSAEPSNAVLVCTARTTSPDDNPALAALAADLERRGTPTLRLELSGIDVDAVGLLVESAVGRTLDDRLLALATRLQQEAAGNPLYVEALLASLPTPDSWQRGQLPRTLAETVTRRVARLPAEVDDLLHVASVAGLDFDLRVAARAAGRSEAEALDALEGAGRAGLLEEVGPNRYRFAHALVRSALRSELSLSRRARIHLRVGESLEALHGDRSEEHASELAHHFFEAVPAAGPEKAYHYALLAADRATRLLSHHEAADEYGRALELLDHQPLPGQGDSGGSLGRADLLLARGLAQYRTGEFPGARATLRAAADEAASHGEAETLARAAVAFTEASIRPSASSFEALELLERADAALPREATALRALTVASLSRVLNFSGQRADAVARSDEAVAIARSVDDPETLGPVLVLACYTYRGIEYADELATRSGEVMRIARQMGDDDLKLFGSLMHAESSAMLGDLTPWDEHLPEQLRLLEVIRQPYCEHEVTLRQFVRNMLAGELAVAERMLAQAQAIGASMGWERDGLYALDTFLLRREQGRLAGLGDTVRSVVADARPESLWGPGLAPLYLEVGLIEEARDEYERLAGDDFDAVPRDATRPVGLGLLADVCVAFGDRRRAGLLLDELAAFEGRLLLFPGHGVCLGPADRLLAGLASTAGDETRAIRWSMSGLDLARRLPSPLWTAHCLYDVAVRGQRADSPAMLAEAAARCERHGLAGLARRLAGTASV
jgi:DNA-binding SARP family transcriptional activator